MSRRELITLTGTFSFLFDSSDPVAPSWYGERFNPAFLSALKVSDQQQEVHSWLLRGDLLIHHLGSRLKSIEHDGHSFLHTIVHNRDVVKTAIFDFIEWVRNPPSRFDNERLQNVFVQQHVAYCITATGLPLSIAQAIDSILQKDSLYLGMAAVDLGNPVMAQLLINDLIKDAGVSDGTVWLEEDCCGDIHSTFQGADNFGNGKINIVPAGGLLQKFGPLPEAELSTSGLSASTRLAEKSKLSLQERVLLLLAQDRKVQEKGIFRFDALDEKSFLESSVPPKKLTHYILNPDHPDGHSKAKFFNDVLEIRQGDWRYLMAHIHEGVLTATLNELQIKRWDGGYGVSFNAILPIKGRNGRVATISTNWIMESSKEPHLVTLYPYPCNHVEQPSSSVELPLVPNGAAGDARWQVLYKLAHQAGMDAHNSAVPTPMLIKDYGGYADGSCGFAFVHVPDARRDFARWLLRVGYADKGYPSGVTIYCPREGQSMDRAFSYATAFAKVLAHNGVICTTEKRLD